MNIKEITSNIYYTGVNDRSSEKFEALWHLRNGVSYNSYIVQSNKIALIDTVHTTNSTEFANSILNIIGQQPIDYLVINHMEPDHSGSIINIIQAYPDIKIIGNKLTISMIKGFYNICDDNRFIEVKDNDEISLGDKTLKFIMTPMIHWPETMMTYIKEQNLIFSGDAFGAFGALNGGVIDHEINTDIYFEEMYRYYSNIVGKYGTFVQKALSKTKNYAIDYICPTHGPVWHNEIDKVVTLYDNLSRYEAQNGIVIVYGSMYGNTAILVDEIAQNLCMHGIKNIKIHNISNAELSDILADIFKYKGLIIGAPTYSMTLFPPIETLMKALQTRELKNRIFATFGSYTWSSVATKKLSEYAQTMNMPIIASLEMKQSISNEVINNVKDFAKVFIDKLNE